jgi:hypothetical protein
MKKSILVILGVDSHLERIKKCASSIKAVFEDSVDIGIATFGNSFVEPSKKLENFSSKNKFIFYDSPRQNFLDLDPNNKNQGFVTTFREFHVCELLGNLLISKHYYDLGYDEVFLLHNDLFVVRNFLPVYRKNMVSNWAFVVPYTWHGSAKAKISLKELMSSVHKFVKPESGPRFTQTILIFNKQLLKKISQKISNQKSFYEDFLINYNLHGDIALTEIWKDFFGFEGQPIEENILLDSCLPHPYNIEAIIKNSNITHLHGKSIYCKYENTIIDLIDKIKEEDKKR